MKKFVSLPDLRVAFVTDIHVREAERELHGALLRETLVQVKAFAPDLILVGGDLAGLQVPHKATVWERNALADLVSGFAACAPVVCVRGNHDYPGDFGFLRHFPNVTWIEGDPALVVLDGPADAYPSRPLAVFGLPWLDRSRFAVGADYQRSVRDVYASALKSASPELAEVHKAGGVCFLLGHAAVAGAHLRLGQPTLPTEDPTLDLGELLTASGAPAPGRFAAGFLGHYHAPQDLALGCRYGGSLLVNEYGEDSARGWTSWTESEGFRHRPIAQPARSVIRYSAGVPPQVDVLGFWSPGDKVKLAVAVPSPGALAAAREEAAVLIGSLAAKGVEAKAVFEVVQDVRSRVGADATAAATTMEAKLAHWVESLDARPEGTTVARARELLAVIEADLVSP
jgi:DNA repair exonuclease SbcCD nuclease subunit